MSSSIPAVACGSTLISFRNGFTLSAAIAYSLPMVQYVPAGVPYVLDMQDVDSEKWIQYSRLRWPSFVYATEARRVRKMEIELGGSATGSLFTTRQEELLFPQLCRRESAGGDHGKRRTLRSI